MIVSASRRTDIPAFYTPWFMNRIRAGFCLVPNPFNPKQIRRVSLQPEEVSAIVFWTKNPRPLLEHLQELNQRGFRYYFQYTLTGYPKTIEKNLPPLEQRIESFKQLSDLIGPEKVIWRYDPIILSNITNEKYHIDNFQHLCGILEKHTGKVVISLLDLYAKTRRRLSGLEALGLWVRQEQREECLARPLLQQLADIAQSHGITIAACSETTDYSDLGIAKGKCIDDDLIRSLWGIRVAPKKDPGQRSACGCAISRDIGVPNTCLNDCEYCYATVSGATARLNHELHNEESTCLIGNPDDPDQKKATCGQVSLF